MRPDAVHAIPRPSPPPIRRTAVRTIVACAVIALCGALALVWKGPVERRPSAYALSYEIMSPFCPGLTLAACPSSQAQSLRDEIATRLEAGDSRETIMQDLVVRYGEGVRGAPEAEGAGLVVWLLPLAIGVVVLAVVAANVSVRRSRQPANVSAADPPVESQRLDDELAALD